MKNLFIINLTAPQKPATVKLLMKEESGAYAILSAIFLTLLLAIVSFSISVGGIALQRVKSQAAADLAVVSAAAEYIQEILAGTPQGAAELLATGTGQRMFSQNRHVGGSPVNLKPGAFQIISEGTFAITYAENRTVLFGNTSGIQRSELASNIVSESTVSASASNITVSATDILNAVDNGSNIENILKGLEISVTSNDTNGYTELSNGNGVQFDGSNCRAGRFLGFYTTDTSACSFYAPRGKSMRISLENTQSTLRSVGVTISDIHAVHKNAYPGRPLDSVFVDIYNQDDIKIGRLTVDALGNVSNIPPGIIASARPLGDNEKPNNGNSELNPDQLFGLLDFNISREEPNGETIKLIEIFPGSSSFQVAEIRTKRDNNRPVILSR